METDDPTKVEGGGWEGGGLVGVVIHRWRRFVSAEGNTSSVINGFESSEGNDGDLAEVEPVVVYSSVRRRPPSFRGRRWV